MALSLLILLAGFFAQLVDGSLSMGFGVTSSSLLLSLGFSTALASAAVHTAEIFTTLISGASHLKLGNVDRKVFIPLTLSGVAGGIAGAAASVLLQGMAAIRPFVAALLLVLGALIFLRFASRRQDQPHQSVRRRSAALIGFPAAFVDAIGGGGWGPIATPSLIMRKSQPRQAIGTVSLAEFFITLSIALTFFALLPSVEWAAILPLVAGGILAAPPAAYLAKRTPTRALGVAVGLFIMLLSVHTILRALF